MTGISFQFFIGLRVDIFKGVSLTVIIAK